MNPAFDAAAAGVALDGFIFAAILAAIFAVVCIAYLVAMWRVSGRLSMSQGLMIHTLFLLWQSNIAFVAVVAIAAAKRNQEMAGELLLGWGSAPLIVPSAALLYSVTLLLCVGIAYQRGLQQRRAGQGSAGGTTP